MMNLSLFGNIRIKKSKFAEMLALENNDALNRLIRFNWIESDDNSGKVSLHQIILDLVYVNLRPTSGNCQCITNLIADYLNKNSLNLAERDIRTHVAEIFMNRVSGKNLLYAELCLSYGKKKYIERATEICFNSENKSKWDILQRSYRMKIKYTAEVNIFEILL